MMLRRKTKANRAAYNKNKRKYQYGYLIINNKSFQTH